MGLLDLLLPGSGAAQFADNNQNLLGALGAGLAQGPTLSQGVANAAAGMAQAKQADQSKNATVQYLKAKYPDLANAVAQGLPVSSAWSLAIQREQDANKAYTLAPGDTLYQNGQALYTVPNRPQNVRSGVGQPVYGKNKKTGSIVPFEPMSDGTLINTVDPNDAASNYDFDPSIVAFQRASGTAQGKIGGGTLANLPIAAQTAQNALDTVAKLRADQAGQSQTFGTYGVGPLQIPDQFGLTMPGTPKADFRATLQQAGGQAFLNAYQQLKGAGAISDAEGQKAGAAISRMMDPNISQSAFNAALDDYEAIIKAGYQRLTQQAATTGADPSTMPQLGPPTGTNAASGPVDYRTYFGGQ